LVNRLSPQNEILEKPLAGISKHAENKKDKAECGFLHNEDYYKEAVKGSQLAKEGQKRYNEDTSHEHSNSS